MQLECSLFISNRSNSIVSMSNPQLIVDCQKIFTFSVFMNLALYFLPGSQNIYVYNGGTRSLYYILICTLEYERSKIAVVCPFSRIKKLQRRVLTMKAVSGLSRAKDIFGQLIIIAVKRDLTRVFCITEFIQGHQVEALLDNQNLRVKFERS